MKNKSYILFPTSIIANKKFKLSGNLAKNLVIHFYHSIDEMENVCKDINIDLIVLEDRIFNEYSIEKIKSFASGIILIDTGKLKKLPNNMDKILGLITKNNLSIPLLNFTLEKSLLNLFLQRENNDLKTRIIKQENSFIELHDIGVSLSKGKNIDYLLETIVTKSMQLTSADGGSLYLLENITETEEIDSTNLSKKQIHQKFIKNLSLKINLNPKTILDLNKESICGNVILNGESIIIDNINEMPENNHFSRIGSQINKMYKYHVKSILTVPIFNNENIAIGAIQLVNRKRNFDTILGNSESVLENVIPFEKRDLYFLESIASQASVALRNTNLMKSIHLLFDGFINASVRAIESRDPTTSGHSSRVATLTLGIAETINHLKTGKFATVTFNKDQLDEIRYASLLHDFGKIGVRERVLVKSKKLYPDEFQELMNRFRLIKTLIELKTSKKQISYFIEESREKALDMYKISKKNLCEKLEEFDEINKFIIDANEPKILSQNVLKKLNKLAKQTFHYPEGITKNYLSKQEVCSLSIKKGSLNAQDRKEIESHVNHTFNFLKIIPWTKNLARVPEIAHAHHEKLNGEGYPRKLKENEIPLESKIMAVADIYDALTAWDRPYKNAISQDRALDILFFEAEENHIDRDLLDIFVNRKIFTLVERKK